MRNALLMPAILIFSVVALAPWQTRIAADEKHVIVTNNDVIGANSATLFTLDPPGLKEDRTFMTGGTGEGGGFGALSEALAVRNGSHACIYLSDAGSYDVAAFIYPSSLGMNKVGNYQGPSKQNRAPDGDFGIGLAARGSTLVTFFTQSTELVTWTINSDCSLTMESTFPTAINLESLAISPDGNTLVVGQDETEVDSFTIGPNGTLTEHGAYPSLYAPSGVDITADGKYALFGAFEINFDRNPSTPETAAMVYPINSDGSLGAPIYFANLASGGYDDYVSLSPDGRFLYVSDNYTFQTVSLAFSENPVSLTFVDQVTANDPNGFLDFQGHLATMTGVNDGIALATAESGTPHPAVGLYRISASGMLKEIPGSPFIIGGVSNSGLRSLAVYPPRPF